MTFSRTLSDIETDENNYSLPECNNCQCQGIVSSDTDLTDSEFCYCLIGHELNKLFATAFRQVEEIDYSSVPKDYEDYKALYIAQERAEAHFYRILNGIDESIIREHILINTEHMYSHAELEQRQRMLVDDRNKLLKLCDRFGFVPFDAMYLQ